MAKAKEKAVVPRHKMRGIWARLSAVPMGGNERLCARATGQYYYSMSPWKGNKRKKEAHEKKTLVIS